MSKDAYVSIRHAGTRVWGEPEGHDAVVMVDIHPAADFEALRNVSPTVLRQRGALLVIRTNLDSTRQETPSSIADVCERWGLGANVALLKQPVGKEPTLTPVYGDMPRSADITNVLRNARAIELQALLEWGRAIWRPTAYHYRLPSGEHTAEFIKVADAIREPHDAEVLASWLLQHLSDRMGLVVDTGTLTPIAQSLLRAMEGADWQPNHVAVLEQYPATAVDILAAIDLAAGDAGNVLALVSMNASGDILGRLHASLVSTRATLSRVRIEVMVNRSQTLPYSDVEVWSPLPGQAPLVHPGAQSTTCRWCNSPDRSRIVPINPETFDGMMQAQLNAVVPSPAHAMATAPFWTAADACGAVAVQARPHPALASYRSDEVPMGVVVRMEQLILRTDFADLCHARIGALQAAERMGTGFDLVLAPLHETAFTGYARFWEAIRDRVAPEVTQPTPYPLDTDFATDLQDDIRDAGRILLFSLGVVTGTSLQQGLVGVQIAKSRDVPMRVTHNFDLEALTLHARPATLREWEAVRNSFGRVRSSGAHALHCGWQSIIPEFAPLHDELTRLSSIDPTDLPAATRAFFDERLRLCSGAAGTDRPPLFWGAASDAKLTPNSLFGDALSARATYAAVGAAMNAARIKAKQHAAPEFKIFELAAMVRSYYDPLILASFFRWLRPHEAWWGWQASEAETTVQHLLHRAPVEHRQILVPELLVAAAHGKLTAPALAAVQSFAELLEMSAPAASVVPALDLGRRLVETSADL